MGRPMVRQLLASGYPVVVHDRRREAARDALAAGAVWGCTPGAASRNSRYVITCLPQSRHISECMLGSHGALAAMAQGSVWINLSTSDYHNTLRIAKEATTRGVHSLDAPVSNLSHMGVERCNVSFFVGGDAQTYSQCRRLFEDLGRIVLHVGDIRVSQTVKLLTNLLFYTATVAAGEVLCLAAQAGIPVYWMWRLMQRSSGNCVAVEQFLPFVLDRSYDHSCSLAIAEKDMLLIMRLADELGVDLPLGSIVAKRYRQACNDFGSADNHLKVIKLSETDRRIDLHIPGFVAPSKYGADRNYSTAQAVASDSLSGLHSQRYPICGDFPDMLTRGQRSQVLTLCGMLAYVNRSVLEEGCRLAQRVGLTPALLRHYVISSVGACRVANLPGDVPLGWGMQAEPRELYRTFDLYSAPTLLTQLLAAGVHR